MRSSGAGAFTVLGLVVLAAWPDAPRRSTGLHRYCGPGSGRVLRHASARWGFLLSQTASLVSFVTAAERIPLTARSDRQHDQVRRPHLRRSAAARHARRAARVPLRRSRDLPITNGHRQPGSSTVTRPAACKRRRQPADLRRAEDRLRQAKLLRAGPAPRARRRPPPGRAARADSGPPGGDAAPLTGRRPIRRPVHHHAQPADRRRVPRAVTDGHQGDQREAHRQQNVRRSDPQDRVP
jgi:hypothetical protein